MDPTILSIVVAVAIVAIIVVVWLMRTRQRSAQLRDRFGPEYDGICANLPIPQSALL